MAGTVVNHLLMEKHRQLVETLYTEPKDEEILGSFLHIEGTAEVPPVPVVPKKKKKDIPNNN